MPRQVPPGPGAISTARRRRKRGERGDWPPLQAGCSCRPQSVLTAPRIHCCKKSGLRPGTRTMAEICLAGPTVPLAAPQFGWALYCCEGETQKINLITPGKPLSCLERSQLQETSSAKARGRGRVRNGPTPAFQSTTPGLALNLSTACMFCEKSAHNPATGLFQLF